MCNTAGLLTVLLFALSIFLKSVPQVRSTVVENASLRGLLVNETKVHGSQFDEDEFSGSDSSGYGTDFGSQIQIPTDFKDLLGIETSTNRSRWSSHKVALQDVTEEEQVNILDGSNLDSDWSIDSSGDNQLETWPIGQTEAPLGARPIAQFDSPTMHPPQLELSCEARKCHSKAERLHLVSTGGNTIPSAVEMVLYCTVHSAINTTVTLTWYLPDGDKAPHLSLWDDFQRMTQSEKEDVSNGQKVTVGIFRLRNVTEDDSGSYSCQAVFQSNWCCSLNGTVSVQVYTPPSVATDVAIVIAICFLELIIIVYLKSRSDNKCEKSKKNLSTVPYRELQVVQNKT